MAQLRRDTLLRWRLDTRRRLAARYLSGEGIEIGALQLPLELPPGARVRYVDYKSTRQLREEHPELDGIEIADVDIVDDGERLSRLPDGLLDFVVANHMLEHSEDTIGTLMSFARVLRPGGVVLASIPDKRRTFDRDRPVTTVEHVIRDYLEGPQGSRGEHYVEWARYVDRVPDERIEARAREAEGNAQRIHFHVWTPRSFAELLEGARARTGLPLEVEKIRWNLSEFVAVLRKEVA